VTGLHSVSSMQAAPPAAPLFWTSPQEQRTHPSSRDSSILGRIYLDDHRDRPHDPARVVNYPGFSWTSGLLVAVVLVSACGGGGAAIPVTSPSSIQSNSSPLAVPTLTPSDDPSKNCRLPVIWSDTPDVQGFYSFGTGDFVADPTAAVASTSTSGVSSTGGTPPLLGFPVTASAYSVGGNRWVPARPEWISTDGLHYVFPRSDDLTVRYVEVSVGTDQIVSSGQRRFPLGWNQDTLLLTDWPNGGAVPVYSVTPPAMTVLRTAATVMPNALVAAGGIWQGDQASGVETFNLPGGPAPNRIIRVDPATGQQVPWIVKGGTWVSFVGSTAAGHPLIQVLDAKKIEVLELGAPNVVVGSWVLDAALAGRTFTDKTGVWIAEVDGRVGLLAPAGSTVKFAGGSPHKGVRLAGACS